MAAFPFRFHAQNPVGAFIRIRIRPRMICDCIRDRTRMDKAQYKQALEFYITDTQKNMEHLKAYAKTMSILRNVGEELLPLL